MPRHRMARHPRFARPRMVKMVPRLSFLRSRRGSGLWRKSSGSGVLMSSGAPHVAGDGPREYCGHNIG